MLAPRFQVFTLLLLMLDYAVFVDVVRVGVCWCARMHVFLGDGFGMDRWEVRTHHRWDCVFFLSLLSGQVLLDLVF